jgi:two-component system, chemotaxis family, sensor kinase CheA
MLQPTSALGDPNAFRAIFFEETQDHLANVEAILLRLDTQRPLPDDLNAIFRAVHSIKGSAAMLGCADVAALTHLQENLLDLLRKGERPLEPADVSAMLTAGDTVRSQVLHHRGLAEQPPDSSQAEALLRERVARPCAGAPDGAGEVPLRTFRVRLAPLAEPIDPLALETMLGGLAEMGTVSNTAVDNIAGGSVSFDVALQGSAFDLQSVLSLVVSPELIALQQVQADEDGSASASPLIPSDDPLLELFVSPEDLKKNGAAAQAGHPAGYSAHDPISLAAPDATYIRVATEKIDLLVNLVGELVITEAMLSRSIDVEQARGAGMVGHKGLADLTRHTRDLQEAVLAIRMLPISNVFSRFPRLVHELSASLGKRVEMKVSGEATELDRGLIEKISDPLTHLVRNAIDHGLESPHERLAAGKPVVGSLKLRASQRGGNIVIEVSDDGRGLDRERILARAAQRGVVLPPDAPDAQVWELIFEAGFSTAERVTELSGRGVGMDVVRRNIQALGGTIDLHSTPGRGLTATVSVPLTLAIMEAMTVSVGSEIYVLPLATVVESRTVEAGEIHRLPGQGDTLRVRDDFLPVIHLAEVFPPRERAAQPAGMAVIVEADACNAALMVDELVGQQQVVVKSLEANFRKVPGLSGATVMADGSVALILDVSHLVRMTGRHLPTLR